MNERRIPGLQAAVIKDGKIVYSGSFGIANLQDSVPVTSKSIFAINSCTKAFTGVAIMQLAEEGKVDLNAPVSQYLNNLPVAWQKITIRQLLTHISGLPNILRVLNPVGGLSGVGNEETAWMKVKNLPMDFPTGEHFSYNQTNYALLGKVIDTVSGESFADVFIQKQFKIANMRNTGFGDSRDVIPHMAPTYRYVSSQDGKFTGEKYLNNYAEFSPFRWTASGMNSTAEDLANWIIALQQGKIFYKQSTIDTLWKAGFFNNGEPTQWALGWVTKPRRKHSAVIATGGGRSAFFVYPEDNMAVVVLTNLAGAYPEDFIDELAGYFNPAIPASDPITILRVQLRKRGFEKAKEVSDEIENTLHSKAVENDVNDWAYRLMSNGYKKEALEIFKLNVYLYPNSWNVYDSYGEALLQNGNKEEAIRMYKKSVELNPGNEYGKKVLEREKK